MPSLSQGRPGILRKMWKQKEKEGYLEGRQLATSENKKRMACVTYVLVMIIRKSVTATCAAAAVANCSPTLPEAG